MMGNGLGAAGAKPPRKLVEAHLLVERRRRTGKVREIECAKTIPDFGLLAEAILGRAGEAPNRKQNPPEAEVGFYTMLFTGLLKMKILIQNVVRRARDLVRYLGWQFIRPSTPLACGAEVTLQSESDWQIFVEVFAGGEYDLPIIETLSSVLPGQPITILDLGANVGLFSARVAELMLRCSERSRAVVFAVEGNSRTYEHMIRTLRGVPHELIKIKTVHGLVGKRSGEAFITCSTHAGSQGVISAASRSRNPLRGAYAIPATYIDLMSLLPPDRSIDLIKCDIEGSERDFLEHYEQLLRRTERIVIELHPLRADPEMCRRRLAELGFKLHREIRNQPTMVLEYYVRSSISASID
jgi:FkbM family methyltransferase